MIFCNTSTRRADLRTQGRAAAAGLTRQSGFTLVELIIVLSIAAMLAVYAQARLVHESEEFLAQGSGTYIQQVAAAAEQHALVNYEALSEGGDVLSTVDDLKPTIPELIAEMMGLNPGFPYGPGSMPTRQEVRIDLIKQNCPGVNCMLQTLVCTTTPITLGGAKVRFDLAQVMVDLQRGIGGQALQTDGSVIRGPALSLPNPFGNVPGIVCGSSTVNTAIFQQFVRVRDTRDPNLRGNFTVAGDTTLNGPTTINNNVKASGEVSVNDCVRLNPDGRGGFNCLNPNDIPAGMSGGVRTIDVVASSKVVATDLGGAFTGNDGNFAAMGTDFGGEAAVLTSGRLTANRLIPTGAYVAGTPCADPGAYALSKGQAVGSVVLCAVGVWTPLSTVAIPGGACTTEGQGAMDASARQLYCFNLQWTLMSDFLPAVSDGSACSTPGLVGYQGAPGLKTSLLCRVNPGSGGMRWNRFQDITTNLVFVGSREVKHGDVVPKPTCANAAGPAPTAIPQLIPKVESSADGGFTRFVTDNGPSWTVQLLSGTGAALQGNPFATAILVTSCYFP